MTITPTNEKNYFRRGSIIEWHYEGPGEIDWPAMDEETDFGDILTYILI